MAATYRTHEKASAASGPSITITTPATAVVGDVLVACIGTDTDSSGIFSNKPGWVLVNQNRWFGTVGLAIYYRVVDGTEDASYTFRVDVDTTCRYVGFIICVQGADTTNPITAFTNDKSNISVAQFNNFNLVASSALLVQFMNHSYASVAAAAPNDADIEGYDTIDSGGTRGGIAWKTVNTDGMVGQESWNNFSVQESISCYFAVNSAGAYPYNSVLKSNTYKNLNSSVTGITVNSVPDTEAGDLLVGVVAAYNVSSVSGSLTIPDGWTSLGSAYNTTNTINALYKIATASEPSGYDFYGYSNSNYYFATVSRITGFNSGTITAAFSSGTAITASFGTLTTVGTESLILNSVIHNGNSEETPYSGIETYINTRGASEIGLGIGSLHTAIVGSFSPTGWTIGGSVPFSTATIAIEGAGAAVAGSRFAYMTHITPFGRWPYKDRVRK